jgi:hypothetical protein
MIHKFRDGPIRTVLYSTVTVYLPCAQSERELIRGATQVATGHDRRVHTFMLQYARTIGGSDADKTLMSGSKTLSESVTVQYLKPY